MFVLYMSLAQTLSSQLLSLNFIVVRKYMEIKTDENQFVFRFTSIIFSGRTLLAVKTYILSRTFVSTLALK